MVKRHVGDRYSVLKHLDFILLDILALIVSFSGAYVLKFRQMSFIHSQYWRGILLLMCLTDLAVLVLTSQFSGVLRRYGSDELLQSLKNSIYNFLLCCLIMYVFKCGPNFSRTVMILTYVFYWLLSLCIRSVWKVRIRSRYASPHSAKTIFVVGQKKNISQLLRSINSGFLREYTVAGICVIDGAIGESVTARIDLEDGHGGIKVQKLTFQNQVTPAEISDFVLSHHIDEVFIGVLPSQIPDETYQVLTANGKEIHLDISSLVGFVPGDQYISTVGTYKTLTVGRHTMDGEQLVYMTLKRALDLVFGLLGVLILCPLLAAVKICYLAAGDSSPVLYTQTRVGLNGETFRLYKFRSMVADADQILRELLKDPAYRQEWEEKQKFEKDPRITKVGSILRKTSLDEVPQFLNVLKGDMSVIGPRPLVVGELEQHHGLQMYNDVKPGITGWWGCNGRSNTTYEERLSLEYYYVEHCSFYLDLLCFVKTISSIFKKDGAC